MTEVAPPSPAPPRPLLLPEDMPAGLAARAMAAASEGCALVVERGEVIGLATLTTVEHAPPDRPLGTVAEWEVVRVPRDADEQETLRLYRSAAWASLSRRAPGRQIGCA